MYSLELHPDLPIFPAHDQGTPTKRGSQNISVGASANGPYPRSDASPSGPIHFGRPVSLPDTVALPGTPAVGLRDAIAKEGADDQDQAARESSTESVPPAWPKAGRGVLAGLDMKEEDLEDRADFESFSVATYNTTGIKIMENGIPIEDGERTANSNA